MEYVNTALHGTNAIQTHKHTEPSQTTVLKCKKQ